MAKAQLSRYRTKPIQDILHEAYIKVVKYIEGLSDEQLVELNNDARSLSVINCSWILYRFRDDIHAETERILSQRRRQKPGGPA